MHQAGLGEARRADQEDVPPSQDRRERQFDDALLAENGLADLGAGARKFVSGGLGFPNESLGVLCIGGYVHAGSGFLCSRGGFLAEIQD
jgi:hypothetical protein